MTANDAVDRAHQFEDRGESGAAREAFLKALQSSPSDPEILDAYAHFLEVFREPAARDTWRKAAQAWKAAGQTQNALSASRRAVILDLIEGDRAAARQDIETFHTLGGRDLEIPTPPAASTKVETVDLPGPLRSFARMAAISIDAQPEDVLPSLARNVVTNGYHAVHASDALEETEFLKLVHRYLSQARELDKLAGPDRIISVPNCESTQTNDLLRVLGYRMRGACGSEVILETLNAARAFITTDSGFPLAELEQALRTDKPFQYDYHPSKLPILYGSDYWITAKEKAQGDFIDAMLGDPGLCRFYLGMSKLDPETADALRKTVMPARLRAMASVLDFFGGSFQIRLGRAIVPGGAHSASAWGELAGASPDKGAEFFEKLMAKDDGWLASEYDALARIHGPVEDYLTDPARMKRMYGAVRGRITTPGPARPVFRSNTDMMLLTTRLRVDPDGRLHIPGDLSIWKELFEKAPKNKYDPRISRAAAGWKEPDDVLEALFALCRKPVDNEPLKIFMALTDIDRNRPQPLQPATVARLVKAWTIFGPQYSLFTESPGLSDKTILAWMDSAEIVDKVHDPLFRQDNIGMMQGLSGLWQIFVRQGSIPAAHADESLAALVTPFNTVKTSRDLFETGRRGINLLLKEAGATSGTVQERMLGLLAGGPTLDDSEARLEMTQEEQRIIEAQKLLAPDLLFDLADNLNGVTKGGKLNAQLASRLAARVADIQLPRNSMTGVEKNALAFGFYVDKHVEDERKLNLRALIDKAAKDPERLKDVSGQLAPALRDTIVGYNYVHYAPPGAQILLTNPLFVRGHDFVGMQGANRSWHDTQRYEGGWPNNAGGRLVGSLIGLPYALAESEQNFLIPTHTQALIWGDLVPQMMLTARTPRYWTVTSAQVHWVGLHMRLTESLIAEAALNPAARDDLYTAVNRVASPQRAAMVMQTIAEGDAHSAIGQLTPAEIYAVAELVPSEHSSGPAATEIAHLKAQLPDQMSPAAISHAWGSPKPTLATSSRPELLNLRTFPTLMGYSSRIMAESWESNSLYWADVADQLGTAPAQLNVLIPEWTQKVVERIFASHLEDWPALLRSLRSVGEELRTPSNSAAATPTDKSGS
jgi:hypothetical protein